MDYFALETLHNAQSPHSKNNTSYVQDMSAISRDLPHSTIARHAGRHMLMAPPHGKTINTYLPWELLRKIFLYSMQSNFMKPGTLVSVCRYWRFVITTIKTINTYLPMELLREIFLYSIESNQMKSGQLASVCRYWRSVITNVSFMVHLEGWDLD
jgi:hypothetical protein